MGVNTLEIPRPDNTTGERLTGQHIIDGYARVQIASEGARTLYRQLRDQEPPILDDISGDDTVDSWDGTPEGIGAVASAKKYMDFHSLSAWCAITLEFYYRCHQRYQSGLREWLGRGDGTTITATTAGGGFSVIKDGTLLESPDITQVSGRYITTRSLGGGSYHLLICGENNTDYAVDIHPNSVEANGIQLTVNYPDVMNPEPAKVE